MESSSQEKAWNVRKSLRLERETLNGETPGSSRHALLMPPRLIGPDDPELAVQAAEQDLRQAANSSNDEAIASALHALGNTLMSAGRVEDALRALSKYLAVSKRIPDPEGVCDAHMELAFAHKALGNTEGTIKHLDTLQRYSTRHKLPYKLAQAHYYTGEYLLSKSQAHLSTPHLELALDQFRSLGKNAEAERARCAAGISKGQEFMESYVALISSSPQVNPEAITKICYWKNDRIPFWPSS